MAGASIERTLEWWASSLRDVKARLRPLFSQERVAVSAGLFLDGLLGEERRKTGWMRAEAAGDPGPWRQQAILGRGRRDGDAGTGGALRDVVRDHVVEHLAGTDAVLVIDETGFLKQGKASCGVGRQSTGSAGRITNCQIGVTGPATSLWTRGLLIRRTMADGDLCFFSTWCPVGTDIATLVRVEGRHPGQGRGAASGDRGQLRDGQERVRARPQPDPLLAWLAPPCRAGDAGFRHDGGDPSPGQPGRAQKKDRHRPSGADRTDPMVRPGDPAHRHPPCRQTHRSGPDHRLGHAGDALTKPWQNLLTPGKRDCDGSYRDQQATVDLACRFMVAMTVG